MKNTTKLLSSIAAALALSATSTSVLADADIDILESGETSTSAQASVQFCIIIPEILIFGVGALGDDIAKITWSNAAVPTAGSYNGALPGPGFTPLGTTSIVDDIDNGGTGFSGVGTPTATLPVYLFSNHGSAVTITSSVDNSETLVSAGNSIPSAEIATSATGSILHPGATLVDSTADTPADANGIVNQIGTWRYTYNPVTVPVAGTYDTTVVYTASQP